MKVTDVLNVIRAGHTEYLVNSTIDQVVKQYMGRFIWPCNF